MKSAPSDRVRCLPACPLWLLPSLLGGFALAASAPGVSAQAQTVSEIQVTPETMTLGVGQKQALFAAAFDGRGNLIAAAKFTFWSSDTMIARVRKDGTVLGITPGLAKIEARTQGKRASMAVLITGSRSGGHLGGARGVRLVADPRTGIGHAVPGRERPDHSPGRARKTATRSRWGG